VLLGKTLSFSAAVSGTSNASVGWSVNGVAGGSNAVGTITPDGIYSAPPDLPSPATVRVTATSVVSASSKGSAQVSIVSDISVGISPGPLSMELGTKQTFSAFISSAGQPDTTVRWSLGGAACPNACGAIDAAGSYVAPQILPSPASVTLTAQSVADPSKQTSVGIVVTSHFTLQLSAPGTVSTSATAVLVATLTPVAGSNPSSIINWSVGGSGCAGSACGTLSTVTTQTVSASSGSNVDNESADYTAPNNPPSPNIVTITATPQADPTKKVQANIIVQAGVNVSLLPISATVAANHLLMISVQVNGSSNPVVNWTVNGLAGGNASQGQICAANSTPCTQLTASGASQVNYVAPGALPLPNPVTIRATSAADSTKSATAEISVINHVLVSVLPGSVALSPGAVEPFSANVLGTTNQSVLWQLQGAGCVASGACGIISVGGSYTAPSTPPTPNTFQVVAISSDDITQSGTANVTITAGANIQSLHPASVYAGGADGFTLRVDGGGFAATTPGSGSALLLGGATRTTNCSSSAECTAPIFPSDVASAGNVSVQLQNPDGSRSNSVSLVVVRPNVSDESITLTTSSPSAAGQDILVVQPTTAGVSFPGDDLDLNIAALGSFSAGTNTCSLDGNPIVVLRPASGAATLDICLFSQAGFATSMAYSITGAGDVTVVAKQPAGLGIIHLTLQVTASAQTGARTLFVQNTNLDKTAASGVLEVQ